MEYNHRARTMPLIFQKDEVMAAISVRQQQPVFSANMIQLGDISIPFERIVNSRLYYGNTVKIWTQDRMNQEVKTFNFQFKTAEKTHQFFKDLLEKAGAPFYLYASSITASLVPSGAGVKGVIDIHCDVCVDLNAVIVPIFFPGFEGRAHGSILRLTSLRGGTEDQIIQIMNKSFAALNARTHFVVENTLVADRRFYACFRSDYSFDVD